MLIAILNQSTLVSNADAAVMTEAVASQVRYDAAPIWDRAPAAVVFYTDPAAVPPAAHGIALVDTIQTAGAYIKARSMTTGSTRRARTANSSSPSWAAGLNSSAS